MKRMMLLVNPNDGRGGCRPGLGSVLETFCLGGWQPTGFFTRSPGEAPGLVERNAGDYDMVVCLGGDGTLSEVTAGLLRLRDASGVQKPIGYIPLGTTNDVARTLGLSSRPEKAAKNILDGTPFPYDVGQFGDGEFFTYIAAFGAFTEVSYETPQEVKHALGHLAYMLEALRKLGHITDCHARVEYDGGFTEGNFIFGAVTNSTSVAGLLRLNDQPESLSDGLFKVLLVKKPNDILELSDIVSSILSADFSGPGVSLLESREVRFRFDEPVAWTRDGEDGGHHRDILIRNRHPGVEIIV